MKKGFSLLSALLLGAFLFSLSVPVAMAVEFRAEEELYVTEDVDDDAYFSGGIVTIEKNISGDLIVAGGQVTINGDIGGDLTVAGGQITINGNVKDDLRVTGLSINLNGNVGDDLIVAGGQLNVSSDSLINGTVILGTGYTNLLGSVNEDIKGGGGKIVIGGNVTGNVELKVQESLTITDHARINGNLIYSALKGSDFNEEHIAGYIEFNQNVITEEDFGTKIEGFFTKLHLIFLLLGYLSLLAIGTVFVLMFPKCLIQTSEISKAHPFRSLGIGFLIFISSVATFIVLCFTIIGLPLAFILLSILVITLYLAKLYGAVFLARLLINPKKYTKWKLFGLIALGLFMFMVLEVIPYLGWLLAIVALLIGFGAMWTYKKAMYDKMDMQKL